MEPRPGVVVVGGGVAAVSFARRLRALGYDGALTLVSPEPTGPYDRPPLSKQYLAGTLRADELALLAPHEGEELRLAERRASARRLDPERRRVELDDGTALAYDVVVVATGARPRRLPLGEGLAGVHYLRTLEDADRLAADLDRARDVVVVGAGFIGLEVAATAHGRGARVTVLEAAPHPLTRVLGPEAGALVTGLHRDRVAIRCGVASLDLAGTERVEAVVADGERLPADVVVVGVGSVPDVEWLAGSGVPVADGVVCDAGGRTSVPGVHAVGDAARWTHARTGAGPRCEQWQTAVAQGSVAAANVAVALGVPGAEPESWDAVPYFWSDQYEHKVQLCGRAGAVTAERPVRGGTVVCFADDADGPLTGVLAIDNPAALARGRRLVAQGADWSAALAWLEAL